MPDVLYWVMLTSLPKVGPGTFRRLVDHFGSAPDAALASAEDHARAGILKPGQIDRLGKQRAKLAHLEHYLDEISFEGIRILTWESSDYPSLLRGLRSAPPVLYSRGDLAAVEETTMAVIGTRSPSEDGLRVAYALAAKLAELGVTIVSGLAEGIDTAGHRGALDAGGLTAAVLGSGLLRISPKENGELAEEVAQSGVLLSELFPTTHVSTAHLMARNRLQAALSRAVVVIESGPTGGSMVTVKRAVEQKRLVFAWLSDRDGREAQGTRSLVEGKLALPFRDVSEAAELVAAAREWEPPDSAQSEEPEPPSQLSLL